MDGFSKHWDGATFYLSVWPKQVTAPFVAPFGSERKGERSDERGGLWLTICPLGWGLPESPALQGRKDGNKGSLVMLVSCQLKRTLLSCLLHVLLVKYS